MSAPSLTHALPEAFTPALLPGSRYQVDADYATSLLQSACAEQERRFHILTLLTRYLASGAGGRKQQVLAKELATLRELYEAVWEELRTVFSAELVASVRRQVEAVEEESDAAMHKQFPLF